MISTRAAAKLILSGEYSVLQAKPALTATLNYYTQCQITPENKQSTGKIQHKIHGINFNIPQLAYQQTYTWQALEQYYQTLQQRYHEFNKGNLAVCDILPNAAALCIFAIAHLVFSHQAKLTNQLGQLNQFYYITIRSDIPIGSGMGSSASVIWSLVCAGNRVFKLDLTQERLYELALNIEHLQHGCSSGLDIKAIMQPGLHYFPSNHAKPETILEKNINNRNIISKQLFLIHTGKPTSSTGACISHVRQLFTPDAPLWQTMANCTDNIVYALQQADQLVLKQNIRDNHHCLTQLGVVPKTIREFIQQIEQHDGAAKTCGAGSIDGEHAGIILAYGDHTVLTTLCEKKHYRIESLADRLCHD